MKVDILGTKYKIEEHKVSEDRKLRDNQWAGYCGEESKMIVIADLSEKTYFDMSDMERETYRKSILRHEIVHAFLNESGLCDCSSVPEKGWAKHEEMIDWFSIQSPKIYRAFKKVGAL